MATPGNGTCLAQSLSADRARRYPVATRGQGYATESVRQGLLDRIPLLRRMPAVPHAGPAFGGVAPATDLLTPERPDTPSPAAARPRARGKFLFVGNEKLYVRGVTYGTFRPRADGTEVPEPAVVERDFALMAANGINAIRTYSVPPRWLLDAAQRHNLRVMVGLPVERYIGFLADKRRDAPDIEALVRTAGATGSTCKRAPSIGRCAARSPRGVPARSCTPGPTSGTARVKTWRTGTSA